MELFYKFEGLIYKRRNSSQIWEPFRKLKDIVYEGELLNPLDKKKMIKLIVENEKEFL